MNEIAEVWCVNDASQAVGVVNGESYCATCIVYAKSRQAKLQFRCRRSTYDISWCDEHGSDMAQDEARCEQAKGSK